MIIITWLERWHLTSQNYDEDVLGMKLYITWTTARQIAINSKKHKNLVQVVLSVEERALTGVSSDQLLMG